MAPTRANGKICYLEIPTEDVARSVRFSQAVFGWPVRKRGDGSTAFDDGVGDAERPVTQAPLEPAVGDARRDRDACAFWGPGGEGARSLT